MANWRLFEVGDALSNPDLHEIGIGAAFGHYDKGVETSDLYTVYFGTPQ